ncbi:hypothetical protein [Pedobacter sp. BAL39]|uniref:hypothetical protein n=1 Tax=Pedobacter sp. BAL39 TaxID=391596 RepID=UPI001E29303F|nr:hypothetical protein [Pedobacter sp. BAL39]
MMLLIAMQTSCKKDGQKDSFDGPVKKYEIALEGGINTLIPSQYIKLTVPALHPDSLPRPVRNASVVVNDGKSNLIFKETSPGIYLGTNNNAPNYNGAYTLTIKYNDKIYTAVDTLRQVVNIVDDFLPLSTKTMTDGMIKLSIPKHTFGYLNPNKWYIYYGDVPPWDLGDFSQSKYYTYTHFLGSPNPLYPLNSLKREYIMDKKAPITIFKQSLSESYDKYLYGVFLETDWNGLFSGVPTNIEGNISGNAQGYFSVTDIDRRRYSAGDL